MEGQFLIKGNLSRERCCEDRGTNDVLENIITNSLVHPMREGNKYNLKPKKEGIDFIKEVVLGG
jgi:hypothetical protein